MKVGDPCPDHLGHRIFRVWSSGCGYDCTFWFLRRAIWRKRMGMV